MDFHILNFKKIIGGKSLRFYRIDFFIFFFADLTKFENLKSHFLDFEANSMFSSRFCVSVKKIDTDQGRI